MEWIKRLNRGPHLVSLGTGTAEVLYWAYAPHLPDNAPHRHTYFEICQVGAYGRGCFFVEGRPYDITPGDLFIARPGVVHQIVNTAHPEMELFWVSFMWTPGADQSTDELDTLLHTFASSPVLVVPDENESLSSLWQALRAVAQGGPRPGFEAQLERLTASLLLAVAQAGAGPKLSQREDLAGLDAGATRVRLAVRYVHDNLDRRLPVPEISAQVHLSPRQLSRLFARYQGTSPAAYVEQARLERAKALLHHTGAPIKEVAAAVGYETVHHFSRAFSRRFGLPPGASREASADGVSKSQRRGKWGQRHTEPPPLQ